MQSAVQSRHQGIGHQYAVCSTKQTAGYRALVCSLQYKADSRVQDTSMQSAVQSRQQGTGHQYAVCSTKQTPGFRTLVCSLQYKAHSWVQGTSMQSALQSRHQCIGHYLIFSAKQTTGQQARSSLQYTADNMDIKLEKTQNTEKRVKEYQASKNLVQSVGQILSKPHPKAESMAKELVSNNTEQTA